jgi:hypothetical protein
MNLRKDGRIPLVKPYASLWEESACHLWHARQIVLRQVALELGGYHDRHVQIIEQTDEFDFVEPETKDEPEKKKYVQSGADMKHREDTVSEWTGRRIAAFQRINPDVSPEISSWPQRLEKGLPVAPKKVQRE